MRWRTSVGIVYLMTLFLSTVASAEESLAVAPGAEILTPETLEPFHARYRETVTIKGQPSRQSERFVHLQTARYPRGEGLRYVTSMVGQDTVYDEVRLLRGSLEPLVRHVSAASLMHRVEVFDEGTVRGVTTLVDGSAAEPAEVAMEGQRFDGGSIDLVLASLPLEEGMNLRLSLFSSDMGAERANLLAEVRVTGTEMLKMAGVSYYTKMVEVRTLDAKGKPLELPGGIRLPVVKKWIAPQAPYVVRTLWGPNHEVALVDVWK